MYEATSQRKGAVVQKIAETQTEILKWIKSERIQFLQNHARNYGVILEGYEGIKDDNSIQFDIVYCLSIGYINSCSAGKIEMWSPEC